MSNVPLGFAVLMAVSGCSNTVYLPGSGAGAGSGGEQAASDTTDSSGTMDGSGPAATGGAGATIGDGATTTSGGTTGAYGDPGAAAGCGGPTSIPCPKGQFCDLSSNCGKIPDATGVCAPTGPTVNCGEDELPVCGCENGTYINDCWRQALGMLKASEGVCPGNGIRSYPSAYLAWHAPSGSAGTGPAMVVSGAGWAATWANVADFSPETPPPGSTETYSLTIDTTDDLFLRLVGFPVASLPHGPAVSSECSSTLYYRLCDGCAVNTVTYNSPQGILPEVEGVWLWFDRIVGADAGANPRAYCN
ncbi:hypothetical protein WME79_29950 [Sorangium sp. So ce726]|uniref:hypothetical protein n=1 Tax=Sorangium sp. So ce726 TaxID=3133319 RepID=UPI003F5E983C